MAPRHVEEQTLLSSSVDNTSTVPVLPWCQFPSARHFQGVLADVSVSIPISESQEPKVVFSTVKHELLRLKVSYES